MENNNFKIYDFSGRMICVKGIGKLFFQEGFPISISVQKLKNENIEVSILHVADECLKNGWSAKTTYNKIKVDFEEDISKQILDTKQLYDFCYSDYETQREMIFNYLFKTTTDSVRNKTNTEPINWIINNLN